MKKIAVSLMTVLLVLTMTVSVFAAGNFVSSPSVQAGPSLVNYEFTGECPGELLLTPYSVRDTLGADDLALFEGAYDQIKNSDNLAALFPGVKIPEGKDKLAVGDPFFLSFVGCDDHNGHNPFTATIKPEVNSNVAGVYVCVNGEWIAVEYKIDGENIVITSEYYGPYAIVVGTGSVPGTGDSFPWGYLVAMVASAVGLVAIAFAFKKNVA